MHTQVILVNPADEAIGTEEKLKAHQDGSLHRAFSILVFNDLGELLLQQRAFSKYHSGGLWTNTCCSHPSPHETMQEAIHNRLLFEMGFDCELEFQFKFQYRAAFGNGLIEHEIDHVFEGKYNQNPEPNPDEVESFRWISLEDLKEEMKKKPQHFTPWFPLIIERILSEL